MINVEEIMTRDPLILSPESSLDDAAHLMREHRIRHIPVVDRTRKLIGLVTQRDVLVATGKTEKYVVKDVMRRKLRTTSEDSSLRAAALVMQKYKIGCLPVLRNNRLVGIITDSDYVALSINLLEQLEESEIEPFEDFDEEAFSYEPDEE